MTFLDRGISNCTFDSFFRTNLQWINRSVYPTPSTLTSWLCYGRNPYTFYGGIENKSLTLFGARPKKERTLNFQTQLRTHFRIRRNLDQRTRNNESNTKQEQCHPERNQRSNLKREQNAKLKSESNNVKLNWIGNINIKQWSNATLDCSLWAFLKIGNWKSFTAVFLRHWSQWLSLGKNFLTFSCHQNIHRKLE